MGGRRSIKKFLRALSLPFLALVLPRFFSRSLLFFCSSPTRQCHQHRWRIRYSSLHHVVKPGTHGVFRPALFVVCGSRFFGGNGIFRRARWPFFMSFLLYLHCKLLSTSVSDTSEESCGQTKSAVKRWTNMETTVTSVIRRK